MGKLKKVGMFFLMMLISAVWALCSSVCPEEGDSDAVFFPVSTAAGCIFG